MTHQGILCTSNTKALLFCAGYVLSGFNIKPREKGAGELGQKERNKCFATK